MRTGAAIFSFWIAAAIPALAQATAPPTERVTVTGTKDRQVITRFVESLSTSSRITGKIARWEVGICPIVTGLRPEFGNFILKRLNAVAAQVDAPVSKNPACKPNIQIVFTTAPQALADNLRKNHEGYLGYADTSAQRDRLAVVTRAIQPWYTTATQDLHGKTEVDSAKPGMGLEIWLPCPRNPGICRVDMPYAKALAVTGSRLGDGLRSNFYHVIIAADPAKLADQEMGALADYISMLALSQISSLDVCQPLDSITSLLTPGCAAKVSALTANDLGYLRGLYHMNAERGLRSQEDEIVYQISQSLEREQ